MSTQPGNKAAPILKVTISKDFTNLKISTVASNGVKKLNLYNNDQMEEAKELAEFYLETFAKENVLEKV